MSTLIYKEIQGTTEFDLDNSIFFGKLIGINGLVMYEGSNADEFRDNFRSAVDEYIEVCKKNEISIKKEFKGVFNVRTAPEIHEALNALCLSKGIKMNTIVNEALLFYLENEKKVKLNNLIKGRAHRVKKPSNLSLWGNLLKEPITYWGFPVGHSTLPEIKVGDIGNPKNLAK